jgi:hypothetical protein
MWDRRGRGQGTQWAIESEEGKQALEQTAHMGEGGVALAAWKENRTPTHRKGGGRARETSVSRLHRGEAATGVAAQPEFKLQASSFKLKLQLAAADQQLLMGTTGCIADDCILKNPKAQLLNASGGAPVDY